MYFLSFDFVFIILVIFVLVKFKISVKLLSFILKDLRIFLPPTDQDFKSMLDLKKTNDNSKQIIRSTNFNEFINKSKNTILTDLETFVLFFISSTLTLFVVEVKKLFFGESAEMSIDYTFALITVLVMISNVTKKSFKSGLRTYEAKVFLTIFLIASGLTASIFFKFSEEVNFNINYESGCKFINEKVEKVMIQQNFSKVESNVCSEQSLKIIMIILFSFCITSFYRVSTRIAYFDVLFDQKDEKIIQSYGKNSEHSKSTYSLFKVRQILHIFIFILLVDSFTRSFIENYVSQIIFYQIVFIFLVLDTILQIYNLRKCAKIYFDQCSIEFINFSNDPKIQDLEKVKNKIKTLNFKGFEIFSDFIFLALAPLLIFTLFYNRSGASLYLNQVIFNNSNPKSDYNDFKFKTNLLEIICYVILLALSFAKAFFVLGYQFYLKNFNRQEKMYLI